MPQTTTPVLEAKNINIARAGDLVIQDANFSIDQGDYVGIVGPNGGGKTTLILALLNFLPHTNGVIRFFGSEIERFSAWEKVAYISQQATNFDKQFPLTVRELVSLGCIKKQNIGRRFTPEDWKAVDESIDFMG